MERGISLFFRGGGVSKREQGRAGEVTEVPLCTFTSLSYVLLRVRPGKGLTHCFTRRRNIWPVRKYWQGWLAWRAPSFLSLLFCHRK